MTLLSSAKKGAIQGAKYGAVAATSVAAVGVFAGTGLLNSAQQTKSGAYAPRVANGFLCIALGLGEAPFVFAFAVILCTSIAIGKHCLFGSEEESHNTPTNKL